MLANVQDRDTLTSLDDGKAVWSSLRLALLGGAFTAERCRATLSWEDRAFTEAFCVAAPELRLTIEDVRAFAVLLHYGDSARLTPWQEAVPKTYLGGFVTGFRQDEAAVRAAIVEP